VKRGKEKCERGTGFEQRASEDQDKASNLSLPAYKRRRKKKRGNGGIGYEKFRDGAKTVGNVNHRGVIRGTIKKAERERGGSNIYAIITDFNDWGEGNRKTLYKKTSLSPRGATKEKG